MIKICIILRGESFRNGNQHSREIGHNKDLQIKCSESHMNLIKKFEEHELHIKLYTYSTKYKDIIENIYQKCNYASFSISYLNHNNDTQNTMWIKAFENINNEMYDYILVLRFDMLLTDDDLYNKLIAKKDNLLIPFYSSTHTYLFKNKRLRWKSTDTFHWIPSKYIKRINKKFPEQFLLKIIPDTKVLYNIYSDSDSSKINNPMYYFPQRNISRIPPIDIKYKYCATWNEETCVLYIKQTNFQIIKRMSKKIGWVFMFEYKTYDENLEDVYVIQKMISNGDDCFNIKCSTLDIAKTELMRYNNNYRPD